MKHAYAFLSLLGLVLPYFFFAPFLIEHGLAVRLLVSRLFSDPVPAFFGADVIVSSVVLWTFIYQETRKRAIRGWWLSIVANFLVGVSLGLPLFLWLRETAIEKARPER